MTEQYNSLRGRNAEVLGKFRHRPDSLERNHLGPMDVTALANLVRNAANLEGVRMGVPVRHEAAYAGDAHQHAFIAEFAQRTVGGHAGYAERFYEVVLGRYPGGRRPLSGADIVQDMTLHLEVEGLKLAYGLVHDR